MKPFFEDDGIAIYCGDALAILGEMSTASADVLMTDPPYSSGGMFRGDRAGDPASKYRGFSFDEEGGTRKPTAEYGTFAGDNRDQRAWMSWVALWSAQAFRCVRPGGHAFVFSDWRQLPATTDTLQLGGFVWQGLVVWDKGVGRPSKGRFRNHVEYVAWGTNGQGDRTELYPSVLISVPTVGTNERQHVTQKPTELLQSLLAVVPGEKLRILDPFCGSGSTLVAAHKLGHEVIGIDVDEAHCRTASERLAQRSLFAV